MKAKSLFMPLLISVVGLTSCNVITPQSTVAPEPTSESTTEPKTDPTNPTDPKTDPTNPKTEPVVIKDVVGVKANVESSDIFLYGAGTYNRGTNVVVYSLLKQNAFYVFKDWSVGGEVVSTSKYYNFSTSSDVEVVGRFLSYSAIGTFLLFNTSYQPGDSNLVIDVSIDSEAPAGTYAVPSSVTIKNLDGTALKHSYKVVSNEKATITIEAKDIEQKFAITGIARAIYNVSTKTNAPSSIATVSDRSGAYKEGDSISLNTQLGSASYEYDSTKKTLKGYAFQGWKKNGTFISDYTKYNTTSSVSGNDEFIAYYLTYNVEYKRSENYSATGYGSYVANYSLGKDGIELNFTLIQPGSESCYLSVIMYHNGSGYSLPDSQITYTKGYNGNGYYNSAAKIKFSMNDLINHGPTIYVYEKSEAYHE